ncbi:NAD(P)-binding domain-containing protein [Agrobacterium tumefaciens]|uniref:NAD(P)-binding domain-containing protein n=1 Tax=Agrobacterium tumefaciens TaxID=358 RepID=UPI001F483EF6|nr:NAD(P)/FAD-dependent oxidoreductase [Agrobacterium tumefaciens]WCJ66304.1 NAD(P)/FAD-dependent oxidoreductase [Agrobacterium tumefaciens]
MDNSKGLRADILIIGAGQAGLAAASALRTAGLSFPIVDAGQAIGDSWRNRYDTLTLFTPRRISSLPGIPLIGNPDGYATKDEFSDYLERYAASNGYPIIMSAKVVRLEKVDGVFLAYLEGGGRLISQAVIVATGAFSKPRIPEISYSLPSDIQQMHVADFRNAGSITSGPVLVVGDGASGRDVAMELASSHQALLARGRKRMQLPENILGRSIWWWLSRTERARISVRSYGRRDMLKTFAGSISKGQSAADMKQSIAKAFRPSRVSTKSDDHGSETVLPVLSLALQMMRRSLSTIFADCVPAGRRKG